MWEILNISLLFAEIILATVGIFFIARKNNPLKTVIFIGLIFFLNTAIHTVASIYANEKNIILCLFDSFTAAVKAFVCDTQTDIVKEYTVSFPIYTYIYSAGITLAVITSSAAVIGAFGTKLLNTFKVARALGQKTCDIITGCSAEALSYAKTYKNSIIALSENTEKSVANDLIGSGYTVIRRKITKEFLNSRFFNTKTKYNVIFPNDTDDYYNEINDMVSYFDSCSKNKKFHFYIETDENAIATEKKHIDATGKKHRENITLFSRNELTARTFVEENPLTKDIPAEFFDDDTSIKEDISLNMFVIGFSKLNREIYRQFIINNQFAVYKNGEYRAHAVNYFIYDKTANDKIWEINGLLDTLGELSENKDEYFPIPDMPYNVECINEDCYEFDTIKKVSKTVSRKKSFSYILIDTGNVYKNAQIAERFNLLLNECSNFRIFIHNDSLNSAYENVSCYGNTKELFTHEIIVNESLTGLSKSINNFYSGKDNWSELTYFDMYSNISLAKNLRFKLNLLGLDYTKDKMADGKELINEALQSFESDDVSYDDYFKKNTKNALLAQEHFRWNAYHLMSDYLPMKKIRIKVEKSEQNNSIKKTIKSSIFKKHACITTYNGLYELSKYLADKANEVSGSDSYKVSDFDYYKYDGLLLRAMPDFFEENNYSVIKKEL